MRTLTPDMVQSWRQVKDLHTHIPPHGKVIRKGVRLAWIHKEYAERNGLNNMIDEEEQYGD